MTIKVNGKTIEPKAEDEPGLFDWDEAMNYEPPAGGWRLPTRDELIEMSPGKHDDLGLDSTVGYWSSTEYSTNRAWCLSSDGRYSTLIVKGRKLKIRLVRTVAEENRRPTRPETADTYWQNSIYWSNNLQITREGDTVRIQEYNCGDARSTVELSIYQLPAIVEALQDAVNSHRWDKL